MGKVIMSGIVPQLAEPVNYPANFADATWEQIIEACQKNKVPVTWNVGDQKTMTINGTSYPIDIIGKNHDDYSDGSGKAPLTFQMHTLHQTPRPMNSDKTNSGGWETCQMRTAALLDILKTMPSEVQLGIREVNKLTSAGAKSTTIKTTADKLFLLSEIELTGKVAYSASGEGSQYAYYAAGNSIIKTMNGTASAWWGRSPNKSNAYNFMSVIPEGNVLSGAANSSYYVAPAFCF